MIKILSKIKKLFKSFNIRYLYVLGFSILGALVGFTYAAFADAAEVGGTTISVGSADIKLYKDIKGGLVQSNLVDSMVGPTFFNIYPGWRMGYPVKIYNSSKGFLQLKTYADYLTANDPAELRNIIFAEVFEWMDSDNDGLYDAGEEHDSMGNKSIVKWKTEGIDMGAIGSEMTKDYVIIFTAPTISDTKQGTQMQFDFEFDSSSIQ